MVSPSTGNTLEAEECHQVNQQTILSVNFGWSKYKKTITTKAVTSQTLKFDLNSQF